MSLIVSFFFFINLSILLFSVKIAWFLMFKTQILYIKAVPYQCGFTPYRIHRFAFSMQFFAVGMLFMIFDVELLLMVPYIMNFYYFFEFWHYILLVIFLFFLLIGLVYEWNMKTLEWKF